MQFAARLEAKRNGWLIGLLLLGLALRRYHYFRAPGVWHDEAALIVNVLTKNFSELLGPLIWSEAGPPLFLWLERAVSLTLGDGILALRLVPFLASCLSLLLLTAVAWRLLPMRGALVAVFLFAFSDSLLWHGCEAKPYAVDVALAASVLALHVFGRDWPLGRQIVLHACLAPVLILLSYPAAFLCGASLLALLPAVWRERRLWCWVGYGAWAVAVFASFAFLVLGPARAQRCPTMDSCWQADLADWSRPWWVPAWTAINTLEVVRYCFKPLGQVFAVLVLVGAIAWWREGQRRVVVLLTVPLGLALLAAFLHEYPYGPSLEVYAAPALALLLGAGSLPVAAWLRRRHRWAPLGLYALLGTTAAVSLYQVVVPWWRVDCASVVAHIHSHQQPDDAILVNQSEYVYWLRQFGQRLTFISAEKVVQPSHCRVSAWAGPPNARRYWVAFSPVAEREWGALAVSSWFPGRRTLERHEFTGTVLYLVENTN